MGWQGETWSIGVTLDAHAGDKEREHDRLWAELQIKLAEVVRDPRYAEIVLNPPDEIEYEECGEEETDTGYGWPCILPKGHDDCGPDGTRTHEIVIHW